MSDDQTDARVLLQRLFDALVEEGAGVPVRRSDAVKNAMMNAKRCLATPAAPAAPAEPVDPFWLIYFYDTEIMPVEVFAGEGAEEAARARYAVARGEWTCRLLTVAPAAPAARLAPGVWHPIPGYTPLLRSTENPKRKGKR